MQGTFHFRDAFSHPQCYAAYMKRRPSITIHQPCSNDSPAENWKQMHMNDGCLRPPEVERI